MVLHQESSLNSIHLNQEPTNPNNASLHQKSTNQSNIHSNQGFDMQNKALDDKSITLERFLNNRPQPITQGEQLK